MKKINKWKLLPIVATLSFTPIGFVALTSCKQESKCAELSQADEINLFGKAIIDFATWTPTISEEGKKTPINNINESNIVGFITNYQKYDNCLELTVKKVDSTTMESINTITVTFDLIRNGKSYKDIILGDLEIPGSPNNDVLVKVIQWQ